MILACCSTSNEISQNRSIQKRKYRNGYHFSFLKNNKKRSILNDTFDVSYTNRDDSVSIYEQDNISTSIDNEISISKKVTFDLHTNKSTKIDIVDKKLMDFKISNSNKLNNYFELKKLKYIQNRELVFNNTKSKNKGLKSQKSKEINSEQLLFILLMILAFILPPLSVLLFTNIDWKKVLIATLLTCLWWGPGIIYAILVLLEIL